MAMSPHQLTMLMLEKPQALAQLAAAKGIEPPETPEEATEKLKDPSLSPADRQRLQEIANDLQPTQDPSFNKPALESLGLKPDTSLGLPSDERAGGMGQGATSALEGGNAPGLSQPAYQMPGPPAQATPSPVPTGGPGQSLAPAQQPQVAPLAPLTQQMMQPQVQPVAAPQVPQGPNTMAPNPSMVGAVPNVPSAVPAAPGAATAPDQMQSMIAAALAGVGAPSTPGGGTGGATRGPGAPQVNFGQALQPQTLAIIQALAAQQGRTPNLQALLSGAQ